MFARVLAFLASSATILVLTSMSFTTTACGGGVCSAEEEKACQDTHATCTSKCSPTRPGAGGVPEPNPNYDGCVSTCGNELCACLDKCGSTCASKK